MNKETLMEEAYRQILNKIIDERIAPGTPLREGRIAKEFNLSPTPVREAFRKLENEGWLHSMPFKGCVLRKYEKSELDEMFVMRENMEAAAVNFAVKRADADDLRKLRDILERSSSTPGGGCSHRIAAAMDIEFHDALMEAAHTTLISQRNRLLSNQIGYLILLTSNSPLPDDTPERVWEEHNMIYQALTRRWELVADALIRQHVRGGWEQYLNQIKLIRKEK